MERVIYSEMDSIIGNLLLFATKHGLCYIQFGLMEEHETSIRKRLAAKIGPFELKRQPNDDVLNEASRQLTSYFLGERKRFDLPLHIVGTPFQKKVWEQLMKIEYGQTKSYKQIAEAIGQPQAARAVGMANNRNPISIIVPCHRVIGHNGRLVGYGGGLEIKETLLELEQKMASAV